MILVNAMYKAKPGQREAFYEAVKASKVPELSRAEEGNIKYDYYYSDADEDELLLVENWKDAEAFKIHTEQPYFSGLQAIKEEYLVDSKVIKVEVED